MININIKRGDTSNFTLTFNDSTNTPLDLSIYDGIYADLSVSPIVPKENLKLLLGEGITIDNNIMEFTISKEQTFSLTANRYFSDIKVINNGVAFTIAQITFSVEQTSTKVNYNVTV